MIERNKKIFKICSICEKEKDTRTLNIRYQDFKKTYKTHFGHQILRQGKDKFYTKFWVYNTKNFDLCRDCQKGFIKKILNQ